MRAKMLGSAWYALASPVKPFVADETGQFAVVSLDQSCQKKECHGC